ncbi:hypothetical protein ACFL0G_06405 [Candidatus Zixiibacteriota bacterium]
MALISSAQSWKVFSEVKDLISTRMKNDINAGLEEANFQLPIFNFKFSTPSQANVQYNANARLSNKKARQTFRLVPLRGF